MYSNEQRSKATPADVDQSNAQQALGAAAASSPNLFLRALRKVGWGKKKREKEEARLEQVRFETGLSQSLDALNNRLSNQESLQGEFVLEVLSLARTLNSRHKELEAMLERIGLDNFALNNRLSNQESLQGEFVLEVLSLGRTLNSRHKELEAIFESIKSESFAFQSEIALTMNSNLTAIRDATNDAKVLAHQRHEEAKTAALTQQSSLKEVFIRGQEGAGSQILAVQASLAELMLLQRQETLETARFYNSEITGEVKAAANAVASAIALIAAAKTQNEAQLGAIQIGIGEQFAVQEKQLTTQVASLLSQGDVLRQRLDEAYNSINQQVTAVHRELEASVSGAKADLLAAVVSARGASENAGAASEQTRELTTALVTSVRTDMANAIHGRANDLTSLLQLGAESTGAIEQRLTGHLNDFRAEIALYRRNEEMMLRGLTSVAGGKVGGPLPDQIGMPTQAIIRPSGFDFLEQREALKKRAPINFESWVRAFEAGADEYARNANDSLSVGAHPAAIAFRMFLNFHARGRLLDIGCGPQAIPTYLEDYPLDQIAAIDPLAGEAAHQFVFAQSHAEFLPWPDQSFETVVAATSIDHVYLLDVAIAEFARILPRGGRLLIWTGLFAHTSEYDPYKSKIIPEDEYHLFHPGRNWFPECFEEFFDLQEAYDHNQLNSFLAYSKR